jgi:hypothetical protein
MPTPAVEPPAAIMVLLRSAVSISAPLHFDLHRDIYLNLDSLSLLCSRQI